MSSIQQLGYLGFEVRDLAAWESLATDVLGVGISARHSDGSFSTRHDSYAHRLHVMLGEADDLGFVGLQLASRDEVDGLARKLADNGVAIHASTPHERALRAVDHMVHFVDPAGNRLELYCGPQMGATPFVSPLVQAGFAAEEQGLGHCVVRATDLAISEAFYIELLGCRLSDRITTEVYGFQVAITFMHINPRHHSLALGHNIPKRIHHFMLQAKTLDDVGSAFDRCFDNKVRVAQTIGRHPNDHMVSFYAFTPSGFEFEYGYGAREVDDATWQAGHYNFISEWGHRPPASLRQKF
ncbi:MAG: VOC family protein [Deltaproteobacteria bacterium]|jgi:2,3-dihydroxybiphenyl 1,2-dioxygenase|nr:VOC family protein [Deltaproteobacteria bacterium]